MTSKLNAGLIVNRLNLAIAFLGSALLMGCGGSSDDIKRIAIEGSVSVGGELLAEGVVNMVPAEGTTGPAVTINVKDGKFTVPKEAGPAVGSYVCQYSMKPEGSSGSTNDRSKGPLQAAPSTNTNLSQAPEMKEFKVDIPDEDLAKINILF